MHLMAKKRKTLCDKTVFRIKRRIFLIDGLDHAINNFKNTFETNKWFLLKFDGQGKFHTPETRPMTVLVKSKISYTNYKNI